MARHEEAGNGDEVVGELLRRVNDSLECQVGCGVGSRAFTDHHEPDMVLDKDALQELDGKACQSVPAFCNHMVNSMIVWVSSLPIGTCEAWQLL